MRSITTKQLLFCPGPVNLSDSIKLAAINNEVGHREEEFSYLLREINKKLLKVAGASSKNYHSVIITGSGSAANESVFSSVIGNKQVLALSNGEFGERIYQMSSFYNPSTSHLSFGWGKSMNLKEIEKYIKLHKIEVVAMVHHETSTGMLNPIEKIGKIVKKHGALFVVDTVSSFGAEKINIEKANIDFCTSSAGKALGSFPGVSFVIGKKAEFRKSKNNQPKTIYLDLYRFYKYSTELHQTPNTPAIQTFFALNQALEEILIDGLDRRIKKIKSVATRIRNSLKNLKLNFFIDEKQMSNVLTTVVKPHYINLKELRAKLKESGIIIYAGKGSIANQVFQIGNIGNLSTDDVSYFLSSFEKTIKQMEEAHYNTTKADKVVIKKIFMANLPKIALKTNPIILFNKNN